MSYREPEEDNNPFADLVFACFLAMTVAVLVGVGTGSACLASAAWIVSFFLFIDVLGDKYARKDAQEKFETLRKEIADLKKEKIAYTVKGKKIDMGV